MDNNKSITINTNIIITNNVDGILILINDKLNEKIISYEEVLRRLGEVHDKDRIMKKEKGEWRIMNIFTIIGIIVVSAIVGIIGGVAVGSYFREEMKRRDNEEEDSD